MKKSMTGLFGIGFLGAVACGQVLADQSDAEKGNWNVSVVSNITAGIALRTKSPSCSLTGDPDSNGCGSAANTGVWANGDNGDLNYRKGQVYSAAPSFTSELLMTDRLDGYKFMLRGTGMYDFSAASTDRTQLSAEAERQAVRPIQLLDLWGEKDFQIDDHSAHVRVGNQVVNWGESYFASGGINATNSLDIQKLMIPGTQLKQALLPAPMVSFASGLPSGFSTEGYWQWRWNANRYPPVGTFWSDSDVFGRGAVPASYNTQNYNIAGIDAGTIAGQNGMNGQFLASVTQNLLNGTYSNAIGSPYYTINPGNKPQFGLRLGYKPDDANINFGFYYENYTDKAPVLSYMANGSGQWSYLQNRSLYGVSSNFQIGDWAFGTELSYRPHDAVAMSSCYLAGGAADANTNLASGTCQAWKDMKKFQFDFNGQLSMTQTTVPFLKAIGADLGVLTPELTVIKYPGVNPTAQYASTLNGQKVYQLADAEYGTWLNNSSGLGYPIGTGQGTSTSVGAAIDFNLTYDGTVIKGWQVTPGITFYDSISGYTPTFSANYLSGAKSTNLYLLFNQNPAVWQVGFNFTAFFGGNALSQPYSDRNTIGAFVTYNF